MMCHSARGEFRAHHSRVAAQLGDQLAQWERMGLLRTDPANFRGPARRGEDGGRFNRQHAEQRSAPISSLLPRNPENLGRFVATGDGNASLDDRARTIWRSIARTATRRTAAATAR
jgi:hypothetical protein